MNSNKTKACRSCKAKELCTKAKYGRLIPRSKYEELYQINRRRATENHELYRKRQAIVEHPFGTMKRQWGFDHIFTKQGIKRASAHIGLIYIAYNLKRILSIIGSKTLKANLTATDFLHSLKYRNNNFKTNVVKQLNKITNKKYSLQNNGLERLIFSLK